MCSGGHERDIAEEIKKDTQIEKNIYYIAPCKDRNEAIRKIKNAILKNKKIKNLRKHPTNKKMFTYEVEDVR